MYSDPMRSIPDVSGFYELGGADMSDIGYVFLKKNLQLVTILKISLLAIRG